VFNSINQSILDMKFLKTAGLVIAGLLFLLVLISFFLPGSYHVERSIVINADASVPFALAKDFKEWDKWSPWHEIDPAMKKTYSEIQGEVGSYYTWDSENPNAGKGKVTITGITNNQIIENKLEFDGMGVSTAKYVFEPVDGGTKVIWSLEGNGEGMPWLWKIPSKYFNLMMDGMVGKEYEKGLQKLKEISEATPKGETVAGFSTEQRSINSMKIAGIRKKVKTSEMSSALFGKWFAEISQVLSSQGLKPIGAPMTIYHSYAPTEVEVEAAIPVESLGKNTGVTLFRETEAMKAFVVKYYGGYNNMESVYNATYDYLAQKNMSSKGAPMEIYITDPGMEKDTSKWLTEIVFPLD
jgi:effector-binding domain-containing protein